MNEYQRRVECRSHSIDGHTVLSVNVWRGIKCKGVDIRADRNAPEFVERVLEPALAALNANLWPGFEPVSVREVCFDGQG